MLPRGIALRLRCRERKWVPLEDLESIEHDAILQALAHHKCITIVAKELGIARSTLYRKIEHHFGMEPKVLMSHITGAQLDAV